MSCCVLGAKPYTVRRYPASTVTDFRIVRGTPTEFVAKISVQPAEGDDLLQLPEGQRSRRVLKAYTPTALRTVDELTKTPADEVQVDGEWFEVQRTQRQRAIIPHTKALLVRLDRRNDP